MSHEVGCRWIQTAYAASDGQPIAFSFFRSQSMAIRCIGAQESSQTAARYVFTSPVRGGQT